MTVFANFAASRRRLPNIANNRPLPGIPAAQCKTGQVSNHARPCRAIHSADSLGPQTPGS